MIKNRNKNIILKVEGMSCTNCALGIKKHLENKGLENVNVNFNTGEATYKNNDLKSEEDVKKIIKKLGYKVQSKNIKKGIPRVEKYFYFTLFFTIPLFSHMFLEKNNILYNPLVQFMLCLPVYIAGVIYFGKSAWSSIKIKIPNMDVLIFIGSSSAFIYSIYGWIVFGNTAEGHQYLFFETTATIITLVLLGNVLEHRSVKKTTSAIQELTAIQDQTIAKKELSGEIQEIPFKDIKKNDILIVNSGDKIPTDGIIIYGECFIDESMISGESNEIKKNTNNEVIGGTIITEGSIKIKATKVGSETFLSQIIELVKDAQNNKPKIQKTGDKVSAIFTPIVLIIAICTFIIGYTLFNIPLQDAMLRAIAVLVISCPCAMGLATPTAVMVGIGRAAKNGILIKGGDTLEKLASIKNLVFDKTGTLTTGNFNITDFNAIDGNEEEIKNIIYNIETHSSHPIAKSLCKEFSNKKPLKISNLNEKRGLSISAKINNYTYTIGSTKLDKTKKDYDILVFKNKKVIATLNIEDKIKSETKEIFNKLHALKYNTVLLSGDKKTKCDATANLLNINTVFSENSPLEKILKIEKLVTVDKTAMIGDGINDAPALAKATIGISLANATQIAIQSADVILLNNDNLKQLPQALQIGKHTLLTIKQNLFWAFSYNIIAIPIAIAGLLNPMWAALFMAFSDVIVIGNSIRLRYKKIFY